MTDTTLIQQYLDGDVSAFNMLVWRWEKPIFNFVLRTIGDEASAKDICQNTFIRTFKELKHLREKDKFSPWIYRIALNQCRDEMKKNRNKHILYIDEAMKDDVSHCSIRHLPNDECNPEQQYHRHELGCILQKALQALPEEQRVIIVMKQYQGLKFAEIADILQQSVNTVKSRLYYGLRALKKILEESQLNKEVLLHEM